MLFQQNVEIEILLCIVHADHVSQSCISLLHKHTRSSLWGCTLGEGRLRSHWNYVLCAIALITRLTHLKLWESSQMHFHMVYLSFIGCHSHVHVRFISSLCETFWDVSICVYHLYRYYISIASCHVRNIIM